LDQLIKSTVAFEPPQSLPEQLTMFALYVLAIGHGWTNPECGSGIHTTTEGVRRIRSEDARREVLGRRLRLNHERYAEEIAQGLHEKGWPKCDGKRSGRKAADGAEAGRTSVRRNLFDTQLSLGEAIDS